MKRTILDEFPTTRAAIFRLMKEEGLVSIPRIAEALGISHEAARKHVVELERGGWIDSDCGADETPRRESTPGRPPVRYCLTTAGDHLFPKKYPELLAGFIDTLVAEGGPDAATALLSPSRRSRRPSSSSTCRCPARMASRWCGGSIRRRCR